MNKENGSRWIKWKLLNKIMETSHLRVEETMQARSLGNGDFPGLQRSTPHSHLHAIQRGPK